MSLFGDIHEFLDHSCIGPFGTKWTLFQRENCDLQQVFLSKTNTVLIGKQWAGSSWFCHRCISYEKCICFLNLVDLGLFATKCAFLHLENCVCRKYSFKKLTEFSQRNQVVHAAANNTAVLFFFFSEIYVLRSLSWIGLSGTNEPYCNLKSDLQKGLSLKTNSILTGKQVACCSCF
jgi:hypothetical protein